MEWASFVFGMSFGLLIMSVVQSFIDVLDKREKVKRSKLIDKEV